MIKKIKLKAEILFFLLSLIVVAGCNVGDKSGGIGSELVRGPEGLVMNFVPNYPHDKFIVDDEDEPISIQVEIKNKGAYPPQDDRDEKVLFGDGTIYISGFDTSIIEMDKLSQRIGQPNNGDFILNLPAASRINPLGGIDTAGFDGKIIADTILIDRYDPTILVTVCYPYLTRAAPTVCIDPHPFDTGQEKVCTVGSQSVPNQGAPVAVTRIDQEASSNKIQFKITIENVGDGDVMWKNGVSQSTSLLERCNPLEGGVLDRKDFDRVELEGVKIGGVDLLVEEKCVPFADGTENMIRLFDGKGFVICTLDINNERSKEGFSNVQSAYTTPIEVVLRYAYRSTISKQIRISKIKTVG